MLRDKRKKELKQRRGYLLTLFIVGIFWTILTLIIFYVDPDRPFVIPLFLITTFLTSFFTLSLAFGHTRRGLIFALVIVIFLILSYLRVGTLINFILLTCVAITFEFYLTKRS